MPNKTLYVKESDLPLFDQVQEQLGESVSAMFSEFLRERMANADPAESTIAGLMDQIDARREALSAEREIPAFIDGGYAEAHSYAKKALKKLRASKVKDAKILLWTANAYLELMERSVRQVSEINEKIDAMLHLST